MENNVMLRIAVQAKGRLNEQSMDLLKEAGVTVSQEKRKFLMRAADFPAEIIFLRDDDIQRGDAVFLIQRVQILFQQMKIHRLFLSSTCEYYTQ